MFSIPPPRAALKGSETLAPIFFPNNGRLHLQTHPKIGLERPVHFYVKIHIFSLPKTYQAPFDQIPSKTARPLAGLYGGVLA